MKDEITPEQQEKLNKLNSILASGSKSQPANMGLDEAELQQVEEVSEMIQKWMDGGFGPLHEFTKVTRQHLEAIYLNAYNLYQNQRFERAIHLFRMLCMLNHWELKYYLGLAGSYQGMKCYEQAVEIYSLMYFLDSNNPEIPYHAGVCHFFLNHYTEAASAMRMVIGMTQDKPEHVDMYKRASVLEERIEKKLQKTKAKK